MLVPHNDVHELQLRIANFKRTREDIAPSMRNWCDQLIRETEAQLAQLTTGEAPPPPSESPQPHPNV